SGLLPPCTVWGVAAQATSGRRRLAEGRPGRGCCSIDEFRRLFPKECRRSLDARYADGAARPSDSRRDHRLRIPTRDSRDEPRAIRGTLAGSERDADIHLEESLIEPGSSAPPNRPSPST